MQKRDVATEHTAVEGQRSCAVAGCNPNALPFQPSVPCFSQAVSSQFQNTLPLHTEQDFPPLESGRSAWNASGPQHHGNGIWNPRQLGIGRGKADAVFSEHKYPLENSDQQESDPSAMQHKMDMHRLDMALINQMNPRQLGIGRGKDAAVFSEHKYALENSDQQESSPRDMQHKSHMHGHDMAFNDQMDLDEHDGCPSCSICFNKYDDVKHKPLSLSCGHSLCTICVDDLRSHRCNECPICRSSLHNNFPVNFALLELVTSGSKGSTEFAKISQSAGAPSDEPPSPKQQPPLPASKQTSGAPHKGECAKMGCNIAKHCASCDKWLCIECADFHRSGDCIMLDMFVTLNEKKMQQIAAVGGARTLLHNSMKQSEQCFQTVASSQSILGTLQNVLAQEMIRMQTNQKEAKEKYHVVGNFLQSHVDKEMSVLQLQQFEQTAEKMISDLQQFEGAKLNVTFSSPLLQDLNGQMLRGIFQLGDGASLFTYKKVNGKSFYAKVAKEGGRILLFAFREKTLPHGSAILPYDIIQSLVNPSSALTFLQPVWPTASASERIFVRLVGNTDRGNVFMRLCMGDTGVSYVGVPFHRLWQKGKPGESLWGGDCEFGNGSGGKPHDPPAGTEEYRPYAAIEDCQRQAITAGLVAGRHGATDCSSIFRVYLRDDKEAKEDYGFARVEWGLECLQNAVNGVEVSEIKIGKCGLVMEGL